MILYDYFRSSAAYRVRIALNLKGIDYERRAVNLVNGEQSCDDYKTLHPQGLVPSLKLNDGNVLHQSLAICEYLEEAYPEPSLLPSDTAGRARVRALAQAIACDIHPLNNLRILKYLTETLAVNEEAKLTWYRHWIDEGFAALETLLQSPETREFGHGDSPTLVDVCLVPQLYNARRFQCDLSPYPTLVRIGESCEQLSAFARAHPDQQQTIGD
ncbi:MAG: maleylacetoacetate isomerase [Gammaproteobacteria bacterium]|nr:maleylacetoacetate isomerase [Gammaproteobacteria bacterium]